MKLTLRDWAGASAKKTTLAILFTDIVGSTRLCNQIGNDTWTETLIKHFAKARAVMGGFDCCEIKIIGDSFMVVFRTAIEALNFALAFQRDTGHPRIKIRAGIHVGSVRIIDDDIYGAAVNYTARILHWIEGDGVALSDDAKRQVSEDLGEQVSELLLIRYTETFKGFDREQSVWRIDPVMWWRVRDRQPLPDLDGAAALADCECCVTLQPASPADIEWMAILEADTYSDEDAIPLSKLSEWYRLNPDGFTVLVDKKGSRIGHLDILPLCREAAAPFFRGLIRERDLPPAALIVPSDRDRIRDLYVESIIIQPAKGLCGAPAILAVLSSFGKLVARICPPGNVENVYAIAASDSGERLLKKIGFRVKGESTQRCDGHALFAVGFKDLVNNLLALTRGTASLPEGMAALMSEGL